MSGNSINENNHTKAKEAKMAKKDQKWTVSEGGCCANVVHTITRDTKGVWSCTCSGSPTCKHVKVAKLQRELEKIRGTRPKKTANKKEKIVYHFHHLCAKVQEALLVMQMQDVKVDSWDYKHVQQTVEDRNDLSRATKAEWKQRLRPIVAVCPGLTIKRLVEIKDELYDLVNKRRQKNQQLVWRKNREAMVFPESIDSDKKYLAYSKKVERLMAGSVITEKDFNVLQRENRISDTKRVSVYFGIQDRRKIVMYMDTGY